MMRRVRLLVKGTVQGVSFRYYTKRKADELRVAGTVRNLPEGSVEVVCEGEEQQVLEMIEWCRHGPSSAYVEDVSIKWEHSPDGLKGFDIIR
jgi:acylphosphatase